MLIATVPYVGKQLHLDPDPDLKLNYGSGSEHANNFGSGRIWIHNPARNHIPAPLPPPSMIFPPSHFNNTVFTPYSTFFPHLHVFSLLIYFFLLSLFSSSFPIFRFFSLFSYFFPKMVFTDSSSWGGGGWSFPAPPPPPNVPGKSGFTHDFFPIPVNSLLG